MPRGNVACGTSVCPIGQLQGRYESRRGMNQPSEPPVHGRNGNGQNGHGPNGIDRAARIKRLTDELTAECTAVIKERHGSRLHVMNAVVASVWGFRTVQIHLLIAQRELQDQLAPK